MLMLINSILSSFFLLPLILVGMAMVGYNTYKFFRTHPLLGYSGKAEAITSAGVVLVLSAVIVAIPHGALGKAGLLALFSLAVNLVYVVVALHYLKKWILGAVRATQDDLTRRAAAFHTTAFQKAAMGFAALLLREGVTEAEKAEVQKRIAESSALNHLTSASLLGYFNHYAGCIICNPMFGWEDTVKHVKDLPASGDQTDIALRVAISVVGGKDGAQLDKARLDQLVAALGVDAAAYSSGGRKA